MSDFFQNSDVATEILSRLSTKDLLSARCVSKAWNSFISHPAFLRIHSQCWTCPSALFFVIREMNGAGYRSFFHLKKAIYIGLHDSSSEVQNTLFRFLPERVVLIASSNGILCCHSMVPYATIKKSPDACLELSIVIYVCNPVTKEWVDLEPIRIGDSLLGFEATRISNTTLFFGFAFYPNGFSANNTKPCFKLVGIQNSNELSKSNPNELSNSYSFLIYSSMTKVWKTSEEVCYCNYKIDQKHAISVGHMFHWLTMSHYIITFDVEKELSAVIKLPGPETAGVECLGNSEGYLHCVTATLTKFQVWILKDYCKPEWMLKHKLNLVEFCREHAQLLGHHLLPQLETCEPETVPSAYMEPLAFHEEVLCMLVKPGKVFSYSFKTRKLSSHYTAFAVDGYVRRYPVIPHSDSLTSINVAEGDQISGPS
ncbi:unnamed protein product [Dovyalis caffra]|uniref:F-box domain-containing protein n=1 Tax=Dovyalis caffra TaxID=77055 RepID=A0AAV1SCN7_9ROSI|nr:unnamed protein product [Dovyalis caffra]